MGERETIVFDDKANKTLKRRTPYRECKAKILRILHRWMDKHSWLTFTVKDIQCLVLYFNGKRVSHIKNGKYLWYMEWETIYVIMFWYFLNYNPSHIFHVISILFHNNAIRRRFIRFSLHNNNNNIVLYIFSFSL